MDSRGPIGGMGARDCYIRVRGFEGVDRGGGRAIEADDLTAEGEVVTV